MKFAQLFLLTFSLFIIKPANAGLLIEPVLGYNFTKLESDLDEKAYGPHSEEDLVIRTSDSSWVLIS